MRQGNPTGSTPRLIAMGRDAAQRGRFDAALEAYREALAALGDEEETESTVDLLRWIGTAHFQLGDAAEAERWYQRSLEAAQKLEYSAGWAHSLNGLGAVAHRLGRLDQAEQLYRQAGSWAAAAGERRLEAMLQHNLAAIRNARGDLEAALAHYLASAEVLGSLGDDTQCAYVLNDLGKVYTDLERTGDAEDAFRAALRLARSSGNMFIEGVIELNRAELYVSCGRWAEAEASHDRANLIALTRGDPVRRAEALRIAALIGRGRGRFREAIGVLKEAQQLAIESGDLLLHAEILREEGEVWRESGEPQRAREAWTAALEKFASLGAEREVGQLRDRLAGAASHTKLELRAL